MLLNLFFEHFKCIARGGDDDEVVGSLSLKRETFVCEVDDADVVDIDNEAPPQADEAGFLVLVEPFADFTDLARDSVPPAVGQLYGGVVAIGLDAHNVGRLYADQFGGCAYLKIYHQDEGGGLLFPNEFLAVVDEDGFSSLKRRMLSPALEVIRGHG